MLTLIDIPSWIYVQLQHPVQETYTSAKKQRDQRQVIETLVWISTPEPRFPFKNSEPRASSYGWKILVEIEW